MMLISMGNYLEEWVGYNCTFHWRYMYLYALSYFTHLTVLGSYWIHCCCWILRFQWQHVMSFFALPTRAFQASELDCLRLLAITLHTKTQDIAYHVQYNAIMAWGSGLQALTCWLDPLVMLDIRSRSRTLQDHKKVLSVKGSYLKLLKLLDCQNYI